MISRIPLRLVERQLIAPGALHLGFEHAHGDPLPFKPGQFIQVYFEGAEGEELRRSFSLSNPPPDSGPPMRWELATSILPGGVASQQFLNLPLGAVVESAGPFGRFHLLPTDAPQRYLLVGTGTGIAPFRAMLPQLRERIENSGAQVVVLCGARTEAELLYRDEFRAMAADVPGFVYRGCLSRETPAASKTDLVAGYVQQSLMALQPNPNDLALLCGNPAMVDDGAERLKQARLPMRSIRRERYVSAS